MTAIAEPVHLGVGRVFNLRADFPIGPVRELQTRVQDAILPHMTELNHTGMLLFRRCRRGLPLFLEPLSCAVPGARGDGHTKPIRQKLLQRRLVLLLRRHRQNGNATHLVERLLSPHHALGRIAGIPGILRGIVIR
jgi:hypothetical protein